jgi:hypothetical protein
MGLQTQVGFWGPREREGQIRTLVPFFQLAVFLREFWLEEFRQRVFWQVKLGQAV